MRLTDIENNRVIMFMANFTMNTQKVETGFKQAVVKI